MFSSEPGEGILLVCEVVKVRLSGLDCLNACAGVTLSRLPWEFIFTTVKDSDVSSASSKG